MQWIEILHVTLDTPYVVDELTFEMRLEDSLMGMKKVFTSGSFIFACGRNSISVNEAFRVHCVHSEQAASFQFTYKINKGVTHGKSIHVFIGDLLSQKGKLIVHLQPRIVFTIRYKLVGDFPIKLLAKQEVLQQQLQSYEPDMSQLRDISTKLLPFMVFLVRLSLDILKLLRQHNQKRDIVLSCAVLLFVFFPGVTILILLAILLFSDCIYTGRALFAHHLRAHWRSPWTSLEIREILTGLASACTSFLSLINTLESTMFSANKYFLVNFLGRAGVVLLVGILMLVYLPPKLIVVGIVTAMYTLKYHSDFMLPYITWIWQTVVTFLNNHKRLFTFYSSDVLDKVCFFYEYKSIYGVLHDHVAAVDSDGEAENDSLTRKTQHQLLPGWEWIDDWRYETSPFTDELGWTSHRVTSIDGAVLQQITQGPRMRRWVRRCRFKGLANMNTTIQNTSKVL